MKSVTKGNKYKWLIVCMSLVEEFRLHSDDIFARQRTAVVPSTASICLVVVELMPNELFLATGNFGTFTKLSIDPNSDP